MKARQFLAIGFASTMFVMGASAISACVGDDPVIPAAPSTDAGADAPTTPPVTTPPLTATGIACTAAAQCQSGQCVDGVCCESACSGTCERCNLPGSLGKCEAVPDGEDPDNECPTAPLPDAGAPDPGDGGADAAASDAAAFEPPDAAVLQTASDNQCAGRCNGKRACAYAGTERTCGVSFCGNDTEQGRASCDGKGHCMYGREECSAYSCTDGSPGCKTKCTSENDCLATHFCDGVTQTCQPKRINGSDCTTANQCGSNVCDTAGGPGVCCNVDCTTTPGGTCRQAGSVGTCRCSACATGACALFYRDEDNDTFGDMNGTVGNGRAQFACADGSNIPAGFVANNKDCLDSSAAIAPSVRPNQTGWFTSPYTNASGAQTFDYDCSGTTEKELREGPCGFCKTLIIGTLSAEEAPPVEEPPAESIEPNGGFCIVQFLSSTCSNTTHAPGRYCNCGAQNPAGFTTAVNCGSSALSTTCTNCAAAGGAAGTASAGTKTQRCH